MTNEQITKLYAGKHECGIHTLQVSHTDWLTRVPHIVTYTGIAGDRYTYKLSPSKKVHHNSYTLVVPEQMPATLRDLTQAAPVSVERVDFAFDNYRYDYDALFIISRTLGQLIAMAYGLSNNGMTTQVPLDGNQVKDFFIKRNEYADEQEYPFEVAYYHKTLQYPESGIHGRLELRCLAAGGSVENGIQRILSVLTRACKRDLYARLVDCMTEKLRHIWEHDRTCGMSAGHWKTWLWYNRHYLVSIDQAQSLIRELRGDIDVVRALHDYNAQRPEAERLTRDNLVSYDKLRKYVRHLKKCLRKYLQNYRSGKKSLPPLLKEAAQSTKRLRENSENDDPF